MSFVPFSSLFSSPHIYVIPTFQRPYAWEEPQWDDLIHDIQSAAAHPDPYRYFAPIHVVEINNPSEYLWSNYTDCSCHDIASLSASNFRDIRKNALTVFCLFILCFSHTQSAPYKLILTHTCRRFTRLWIKTRMTQSIAIRCSLSLMNWHKQALKAF